MATSCSGGNQKYRVFFGGQREKIKYITVKLATLEVIHTDHGVITAPAFGPIRKPHININLIID